MNRKEVIGLADRWLEVAEQADYLTRSMAEKTACWLYEVAGLSEEMYCPTCKCKMETLEHKQFLASEGECGTCSKLRADMWVERESMTADYYEDMKNYL